MQKYPRGSRGSPAKGVVWETVARVRISSSAPKNAQALSCAFFGVERLVRTRELPTSSREPQGDVFFFLSWHFPLRWSSALGAVCRLLRIWPYHVRDEWKWASVFWCVRLVRSRELPRVRAKGRKSFCYFSSVVISLYHVRVDVIFRKKQPYHVRVEFFLKNEEYGLWRLKILFLIKTNAKNPVQSFAFWKKMC